MFRISMTAIRAMAVVAVATGALWATGPAKAQLPPGMKPFETTKISDGVYTFRFFFHRNLFVVTNDGVIATDPINPKAAQTMMSEIKRSPTSRSNT